MNSYVRAIAATAGVVSLVVPASALPTATAVAPDLTPNCPAATVTVHDNTTPVAIVDNFAVTTTSTIEVSGVGAYLSDVDVQTFITHTFAADLDITVTSPAGTVVTLTTDNGGANDNVFNGTVWDDDADPGGQVPYTTNDGVVTEHTFVNEVVASPLVPEEALGAFIGENPNGTWTLTVSDDLIGQPGTIQSWAITLSTLPSGRLTSPAVVTQGTPVGIPVGGLVTSQIEVVDAGFTQIGDADVVTSITHSFSTDLDITVMSPAGTVVTLSTDNGGGNDNVFNGTLWDDDANPIGQVPYTTNNGLASEHVYANLTTATPLVPEEAMSAFIGEDPNGTWTLAVNDDDAVADGGSIDSWSVSLSGIECAPNPPTNVTALRLDTGTLVSWTPPTNLATVDFYKATASPGGAECTTTTNTCMITGLTNGTTYTVTVRATNDVGPSADSEPSAPVTPATNPSIPRSVTAKPGKTSAIVRWVAPASNGGSPITQYTAEASPGGRTCTTTTTTCTITGLTNGTTYTVTVLAKNDVGSSPALAEGELPDPTAQVTPRTVPGKPTAVTTRPGDKRVTVRWAPPVSNGGAPIKRYVATASPGGRSCTVQASARRCTITRLRNGTRYSVTVRAVNVAGTSTPSKKSLVTPRR